MNGKISSSAQKALSGEKASGVVLLLATIVAMVLANSLFAGAYFSFWRFLILKHSLLHWINDGLMTLFFLSVGIEIKNEMTEGELSTRKKALLPIVAASGGMVVPAIIYELLNAGTVGSAGWGIPMATDIAFALGALALLGKRVPAGLRVFLMSFAVADDIGAILVIAIFYAQQIHWIPMLCGVGVLGLLVLLGRRAVRTILPYSLLGIILWVCFLQSGVHATISGVLLAMVIPSRIRHRFEQVLRPWIAFFVMPLFALANAGVAIDGGHFINRVTIGVIAGLVVGKQLGITLFSWIAVRFKLAVLPQGVSWSQIYGASVFGGIGFTMSIFVTHLAFREPDLANGAKVAVLMASVFSTLLGIGVLMRATRKRLP